MIQNVLKMKDELDGLKNVGISPLPLKDNIMMPTKLRSKEEWEKDSLKRAHKRFINKLEFETKQFEERE